MCVIGNDVATNLFVQESPLGKKIKIGARRLEVIGVLEKRGSFLGMDSFDNEVILPIQQFVFGYWRNPRFRHPGQSQPIWTIWRTPRRNCAD